MMRKLILLFLVVGMFSCGEDENQRETVYTMYQVGWRPTTGSVVITDLGNGKIEVNVKLQSIQEGQYQAHLHFGSINELGELAYRLTDLDGQTGKSRTILDNVELSDGSLLTYDMLLQMDGSVKIHDKDPLIKNTVVAFGNIGENDNFATGGITVCIGH